MGKLSKCDQIRGDEFGLQDYIGASSLPCAREAFKIKTGMNNLRGNFKNKYLKEGVEVHNVLGADLKKK